MIRLDGGFGTMLQAAGLPVGHDPGEWNIENPTAVTAVHRAYVEAGSDMILTNTFGLNRLKYHGFSSLPDLIAAAVRCARDAAPRCVALDVGPTGRLLKPAGDLAFDDAVAAFAEQIRAGVAAGVDLVFIETMSDLYEAKSAILAARDVTDLPVYVTVALSDNGQLLTGASIEAIAALFESLPVDAYGFNCGIGPAQMTPFFKRLAARATKPLIVKPNAGLPRLVEGRTVFDVAPADFAADMRGLVEAGATIVGGCCGTTPDHIRALTREVPE